MRYGIRPTRGVRRTRGRGFTLIELLVVVAIIALLMSILLPTFSRARRQAKRVMCGSNMHQISLAIFQYANDEHEYPTPAASNFWPMTGAYGYGEDGWTPANMALMYQLDYLLDPAFAYSPTITSSPWKLDYEAQKERWDITKWGDTVQDVENYYPQTGFAYFGGYMYDEVFDAHSAADPNFVENRPRLIAEKPTDRPDRVLMTDMATRIPVPDGFTLKSDWSVSAHHAGLETYQVPRGSHVMMNDGSVEWRGGKVLEKRLNVLSPGNRIFEFWF